MTTTSEVEKVGHIECKHCTRPADWRWDDATGTEHSYICSHCMSDLGDYQFHPLSQFTYLPEGGTR